MVVWYFSSALKTTFHPAKIHFPHLHRIINDERWMFFCIITPGTRK
jgi:hypothetical protein